MTMNIDDPARLNGTTVIGGDGEKLGSVDAVYYDNATDRPEWVAVRSGLFGTRVALVPLRRANYAGDALRVPFDKVQLKNAPHHDPGRELSSSDEADLYRYYGIDLEHTADPSAQTAEFSTGPLRGLNRTEERRDGDRTGTDRARLRKHLLTDDRRVTEPVERIRMARDLNADTADIADDVDEIDRDRHQHRYL